MISSRRSIRTGRWPIAGLVLTLLGWLFGAGCNGSSGQAIQPADLYGVWEGETIGGWAYFTFETVNEVNRFELRAAPGEFTAVLDSGEVVLSKGRWGVIGNTLNLLDEVPARYACTGSVADPYDVIMNPAGDAMQLHHLGDNSCAPRGQLLASATWVRQEDNPEGAPGS